MTKVIAVAKVSISSNFHIDGCCWIPFVESGPPFPLEGAFLACLILSLFFSYLKFNNSGYPSSSIWSLFWEAIYLLMKELLTGIYSIHNS
jgi:hypothetical protein